MISIMHNIHAMNAPYEELTDNILDANREDYQRITLQNKLVDIIYNKIMTKTYDQELNNSLLTLVELINQDDIDNKNLSHLQFCLTKIEKLGVVLPNEYKLGITSESFENKNQEHKNMEDKEKIDYFMNYYPNNLAHLINIDCYDSHSMYEKQEDDMLIHIDKNLSIYVSLLNSDDTPRVVIIDKKMSKNKFKAESLNFNEYNLSEFQPKNGNDVKSFNTSLKHIGIHQVNLQFSHLETTIRFMNGNNKGALLKLYPLTMKIISYYRLANSAVQMCHYSEQMYSKSIDYLKEKYAKNRPSQEYYNLEEFIKSSSSINHMISNYRYKTSDKSNERTFFMMIYNPFQSMQNLYDDNQKSIMKNLKKFSINYVYSKNIPQIIASGLLKTSTNLNTYNKIQIKAVQFIRDSVQMFYNHLYTYYGSEIDSEMMFKKSRTLLDHLRNQISQTSYKFNNLFSVFTHIQILSFAVNTLKKHKNINVNQLVGEVNDYFRVKTIYNIEFLNNRVKEILEENFDTSDNMIKKFMANIINKNDNSINPLWLLAIFFGMRGVNDSSKLDVILDKLITNDLYNNTDVDNILNSQKIMFLFFYFYSFCASDKRRFNEESIKQDEDLKVSEENDLSSHKNHKKHMIREYIKTFILLNHKANRYLNQDELSEMNIKLYVKHKKVQKYLQLVYKMKEDEYDNDESIESDIEDESPDSNLEIKNYNKQRLGKIGITWNHYIEFYKHNKRINLDKLLQDIKLLNKLVFYHKKILPNRPYRVATVSMYNSDHNRSYMNVKKKNNDFAHMTIDINSISMRYKPFFNQCLYQGSLPEILMEICNIILEIYRQNKSEMQQNGLCKNTTSIISQIEALNNNYSVNSDQLEEKIQKIKDLVEISKADMAIEYLSDNQINQNHQINYAMLLTYIANMILEKQIERMSSINDNNAILEFNHQSYQE